MKLSIKQCKEAAKRFRATICDGRQWTISTVDDCLPHGWELKESAQDSDFLPATLDNLTSAYREYARPALMG